MLFSAYFPRACRLPQRAEKAELRELGGIRRFGKLHPFPFFLLPLESTGQPETLRQQ